MLLKLKRAAVIGSGVMGSAIAALLANAGMPCKLYDVVPSRLTDEELAVGLTLNDPVVRNRLAGNAVERLIHSRSSELYDPSVADFIEPRNLDDHLQELSEADWIIEAVVENLEVKRELMEKIEAVRKRGAIVTTNTSGISVNEIVQGRSTTFRNNFMGVHFFNPPRHMKLAEIIPNEMTRRSLAERLASDLKTRFGRGVVWAKDHPNFLANRIGIYNLQVAVHEMITGGYTVEEVDAVTGMAMGRPRSATLRTIDLIGLDTYIQASLNVHDHVEDPQERAVFAIDALLEQMRSKGMLGTKTNKGFYTTVKSDSGKEIRRLELKTMTYLPVKPVDSEPLTEAMRVKNAGERLKTLISGQDRLSKLAWRVLSQTLLYTADKWEELTENLIDVDNAMKWGFSWELGPFEMWDAIGLPQSVARMEAEGLAVPQWVKDWLALGNETFYEYAHGVVSGYCGVKFWRHLGLEYDELPLNWLRNEGNQILTSPNGSLIDISDGVACLEFHSRNNALGQESLEFIERAVEEVERNHRALVIANEGKHFCVGADLKLLLSLAQNKAWNELDGVLRQFQNTFMKVKYMTKPVVAAPHRMTLGAGAEICLSAHHVHAAAETCMGLVETAVGVIPGAGGCKEAVLRSFERGNGSLAEVTTRVIGMFHTIRSATTSSSALHAIKLGYMRESDEFHMNRDRLIYKAKMSALSYDKNRLPEPGVKIMAAGRPVFAFMQEQLVDLRQRGEISDHDLLIGNKLAYVLSGGNVEAGADVSEQDLLDLEREAFISLIAEPKTQERMEHMLLKGKALRN